MPETAPAPSSTRYRPTKQYRCDVCGKTFDIIEILNSHKRLDHDESGTSHIPAGVS
jgi:predicted nucleic acid-binding Zn ribbon protein